MKRILYFLLAAGLLGGAVGYYFYNKPHQDMAAASTDLTVDATTLFAEYNADENASNAKYFDKVIAVKGSVKVSAKDGDGAVKVTLDTGGEFGVVCELSPFAKHARTEFAAGEAVTFKGKCTGFNFDVVLTECVEAQ
jgi:hypothetical protein